MYMYICMYKCIHMWAFVSFKSRILRYYIIVTWHVVWMKVGYFWIIYVFEIYIYQNNIIQRIISFLLMHSEPSVNSNLSRDGFKNPPLQYLSMHLCLTLLCHLVVNPCTSPPPPPHKLVHPKIHQVSSLTGDAYEVLIYTPGSNIFDFSTTKCLLPNCNTLI